jgi:7-cyano-7-deazaguanine synthase
LSLALGWAEVVGATDIFVGVNAVDYSGYPDCRPEFIEAFERLANLATKAGVEGARFAIRAPLITLSKADIIRTGISLGVDYGMTVSCYQADAAGRACGKCDSCRLRAAGFAAAGVADPTVLRLRRNVCELAGKFGYDARLPFLGTVAQLVEQGPFKALVLGSSPSRPTI